MMTGRLWRLVKLLSLWDPLYRIKGHGNIKRGACSFTYVIIMVYVCWNTLHFKAHMEELGLIVVELLTNVTEYSSCSFSSVGYNMTIKLCICLYTGVHIDLPTYLLLLFTPPHTFISPLLSIISFSSLSHSLFCLAPSPIQSLLHSLSLYLSLFLPLLPFLIQSFSLSPLVFSLLFSLPNSHSPLFNL